MAKTTTRKSYHEMGSISFQGPDHKMTHNVKAYLYILIWTSVMAHSLMAHLMGHEEKLN